jgi:hypothetical protein
MTALGEFDLQEIAHGLGVHLATVYRWRKGDTSPTARQVYRICSLKYLRPATFAPFTGHVMLYRSSYDRPRPDAAAIDRWVRGRIDRVRRATVPYRSIRAVSIDTALDVKTVRRCRDTDGVKWSVFLRYIEEGVGVRPHDMLEPTATLPISRFGDAFAETGAIPFAPPTETPTQESSGGPT